MKNCGNLSQKLFRILNSFLLKATLVLFLTILSNSYAKSQTTVPFDLYPTSEITYVYINDGYSPYYSIYYDNTVGYMQNVDGTNYRYRRGMLFDCSSIPQYATITGATFHLFALACGGIRTGGIKITSISADFMSQLPSTVHSWIFSGSNLGSVATNYGNKTISTAALKSAVQAGAQSSNHNIGIGAINTQEDSGGAIDMTLTHITGTYTIPTPGMVTGLTVSSITATSCFLSWNAPAVTGGAGAASGYYIYKGGQQIDYTSSTSYQVTGLCPGTSSVFQVYSHNQYGIGQPGTIQCSTLSPTISGSYVICSYGDSYTAINLPPDGNLSWNSSSNISGVGSANTNPRTFLGQDWGGAGTITATVSSATCGVYELSHNVWSGRPWSPTVSPSGYPAQLMGIYSPLDVAIISSPGANFYDANWSSSGALTTTCNCGSSGSFYSVAEGTGYFYVTPYNSCGEGVMYQGEVFVDGSIMSKVKFDKNMPQLVLSPNPASDYLNVQIDNYELSGKSDTYSVQIFDAYSRKIKDIKLSGPYNRISIQDLKTGQYYIRLLYNNNTLVKSLFVK